MHTTQLQGQKITSLFPVAGANCILTATFTALLFILFQLQKQKQNQKPTKTFTKTIFFIYFLIGKH